MLVSLLVDAVLSLLKDKLTEWLPDLTLYILEIGNYILSFAVITVVFAMIYKFLPDAKIKWKVTWTGALITTVLFMLGKLIIGIALGNSEIDTN